MALVVAIDRYEYAPTKREHRAFRPVSPVTKPNTPVIILVDAYLNADLNDRAGNPQLVVDVAAPLVSTRRAAH